MTEVNNNGYFDIDTTDKEILRHLEIYELFELRDLQQRKLFINEGIYNEFVSDAIHHILQYNKDDEGIPVEERKPILLYLSSNGGSVDVGFQLIDIIMTSKTPVYTINLGYQYSMACLIGIAGHKRFAMPNAKFLMHDGSNFVWDSGAKVQDQVDFQKRVNDRIRSFVIDRTKVTTDEYDSKFRVEWYLFAEEAKEKGFIDYIIGEDCAIEEVI